MKDLEKLKEECEAPSWMTEEGYKILTNGYLLEGETPKGMYRRLAKAAASYYPVDERNLEYKFFSYMWDNYLCPSSPVISNLGTERGLPISCNAQHVDDTVLSIFDKNTELAMLSKNGAGVATYLGDIRSRGEDITGNGKSNGIIPWAKVYDATISSINQGSVRRGAGAAYIPITHGDIEEFLNIRRPTGDINRRCLNLNHGVTITNEWMEEMLDGDKDKRKIWQELLKARFETGQPYIMFIDNVNNQNPECYVKNDLKVSTSNICSEITLYTDKDHTFVCCLSSLNLLHYDNWPEDLAYISTLFLDAVMEEYIKKTKGKPGFEASRNFAIKSRALGIGALGWHSLLQEKMIPFESFDAMMLNAEVFSSIRKGFDKATRDLAKEFGEPEWCKGAGVRNSHGLAVAPTVSNSAIAGGVSPGIEPWAANLFNKAGSKGTFIIENKKLMELLDIKGKNTKDVRKSIIEHDGSVQHLDFLSDLEKKVFLTAREISQFAVVRQASQRGRFIDQSQSLNLFFSINSDPKYIHDVHVEAYKLGVKTLYYCRSAGVLKGDLASRDVSDCKSCDG